MRSRQEGVLGIGQELTVQAGWVGGGGLEGKNLYHNCSLAKALFTADDGSYLLILPLCSIDCVGEWNQTQNYSSDLRGERGAISSIAGELFSHCRQSSITMTLLCPAESQQLQINDPVSI